MRYRKVVQNGDMMAVIEKSFDGYHVDYGYTRDGEFLRSCWRTTDVFKNVVQASINANGWVDIYV